MKAMILAGGEGSRLRPLTCDLPKPMVPVANRPCMEHIINLLKRHGITQIGVTLAYLPKMISDYFGTGEAFDVNITYYTEEKPLGTAGCIGAARDFLTSGADTGAGDDSFLVISGDALTDMDLTKAMQLHKEKNAMATLLLKQVKNPLEYGVVVTGQDGHIQRFVEKPSWNQVVSDQVNTGIYIFSNQVLSYIKEGEKTDFAKDVFPRLLAEGQPMYGHVADGYWCDIGDLKAYAQANRDALDGTVQLEMPKAQFGENCQIGKNVVVTQPCLIGAHCIIGDGAHIGPYTVLGDYTVIEENASLKSSILWEGARVGVGAELRGALICQNTKVESKTRIFEHAIVGASCTVGTESVIRPHIKVWPGKQIAAGARLNENVVWDASVGTCSNGPSATSYGATASAGGHGNPLFGERGIEGVYGTTLTPSMLCRIGSAFVASLRAGAVLSIAHDGSPAAGAAALAFLGGATAVGARCRDAGQLTLPILRYLVKEYGHQGAAFFRMHADRLHIVFLDANGCDIPRKQEKKIERLYSTCDLPPAPASVIAPVLPLQNGRELYIAWLQRLLTEAGTDTNATNSSVTIALAGAPFVKETAEQVLQGFCGGEATVSGRSSAYAVGASGGEATVSGRSSAYAVGASGGETAGGSDGGGESDSPIKAVPFTTEHYNTHPIAFAITFAEDGEQFDLYDETGALVPPDRVSALMSFLLLERYGACALALPVDQPLIHEWLVKQYGATLTRTGVSVQDMMERISAGAVKKEADAQLAMRYDAIYFALQLALWLQRPKQEHHKVPLSKLLRAIPQASMAQQDLPCDFHLKGKVMRKLAEENAGSIRETADGIQIFTEKGWILILPDSSRPVVHITTEGYNEEFAKELLVDMERRINGYLQ